MKHQLLTSITEGIMYRRKDDKGWTYRIVEISEHHKATTGGKSAYSVKLNSWHTVLISCKTKQISQVGLWTYLPDDDRRMTRSNVEFVRAQHSLASFSPTSPAYRITHNFIFVIPEAVIYQHCSTSTRSSLQIRHYCWRPMLQWCYISVDLV